MRRIRSNYVLQVHKVTSGEVVHNFINDSWFLCHVATWTSHVATSFLTLSATSRRGFTRRDVKFICLCHVTTSLFDPLCHVATWTTHRDVKSTCLCHVATWNSHVATSLLHFSVTSQRRFTRRDVDWYKSLSRRDVAPNVATSFGHVLCHVATLTRTSRCWLVYSLLRRDVTPHVATWPCFKPKISSFLVFHLTHSI